MGEDARPELPARRDQGSAPARRRRSRRRHHPRHQGLHRRHPQPHLQFPARPGERRFRAGAHPSLLTAGPRRPALDRRRGCSRRWTPTTPSTSASAWTRTPATCATPTSCPPKTSAPGASSRCWWTRRSTTIGWRSSKWTSPARARLRAGAAASEAGKLDLSRGLSPDISCSSNQALAHANRPVHARHCRKGHRPGDRPRPRKLARATDRSQHR